MGNAARELTVILNRLHPAQLRVWAAQARFKVLECGRRWGKTTLGENVAAEAALSGQPVGWFSPTYSMLLETWQRLTELLAPVITRAVRSDHQIRLLTGGVIDCWSLERIDSGRGRKYGCVVIDEASVVRDLQNAWEATIRPTLTDYRGSAWFLGTPKGRNYFHRLFVRGEQQQDGWRSWRLGTATNPHMDAGEIAGAKRELPAHIFAQEYEGVPADDGGNPFGLDAIAACCGELSSKAPVAWGIDLAKSVDWTWCLGLDADGVVSRSERWQGPWEQTFTRVLDLVGHTPCLVDSTGVGDPVLERLQRTRGHVFEGFKFSSTSKQQLMENLAVAIQRHEVTFPDGVLRSELESFEYEYKPGGGVRYSAPQGLHDDGVCALALAVHHRLQRSRQRTTVQPLVI